MSASPGAWERLLSGWPQLSGSRFSGEAFAAELPRFAAAYGQFARALFEAAERARTAADSRLEERLVREFEALRARFALPLLTPFMPPAPSPASFPMPGGLADLYAPLAAAGGAGPFKEIERLARAMSDALASAQAPARAYAEALTRVSMAGFDRYTRELAARLAGGAPTPSLAELFERLIECGESAYREALEQDLASIQARALNAGLRVAGAARALYEYQAKLAGLPTEADMDALFARLRQLEAGR